MRYEVPQFIEIEDKIVGPLTWMQFLYMAGGAGGSILALLFLPRLLSWPVIALLMAFASALAFVKYNHQPFIVLVESWFKYTLRGKLYVWKKRSPPKAAPSSTASLEQEAEAILNAGSVYIPKMSDSKLKDLSWALDIDRSRRGEVL